MKSLTRVPEAGPTNSTSSVVATYVLGEKDGYSRGFVDGLNAAVSWLRQNPSDPSPTLMKRDVLEEHRLTTEKAE